MSAIHAFAASLSPWQVIACMAVVTALTRYTGYWALGDRVLGPRMYAALSAVPASVLTAIIAPVVLATGIAETIAAILTVLIAWRFPTIVAIIGGVVSVVVLRNVL